MDDEKFEAMRQTLELLMRMHMDNEKRFEDVQARNEARFETIARTFETALDSIKRRENIAVAHEDRLDDLEGR
jgi:hypothetical protein